jgi:hypothetical protein
MVHTHRPGPAIGNRRREPRRQANPARDRARAMAWSACTGTVALRGRASRDSRSLREIRATIPRVFGPFLCHPETPARSAQTPAHHLEGFAHDPEASASGPKASARSPKAPARDREGLGDDAEGLTVFARGLPSLESRRLRRIQGTLHPRRDPRGGNRTWGSECARGGGRARPDAKPLLRMPQMLQTAPRAEYTRFRQMDGSSSESPIELGPKRAHASSLARLLPRSGTNPSSLDRRKDRPGIAPESPTGLRTPDY